MLGEGWRRRLSITGNPWLLHDWLQTYVYEYIYLSATIFWFFFFSFLSVGIGNKTVSQFHAYLFIFAILNFALVIWIKSQLFTHCVMRRIAMIFAFVDKCRIMLFGLGHMRQWNYKLVGKSTSLPLHSNSSSSKINSTGTSDNFLFIN